MHIDSISNRGKTSILNRKLKFISDAKQNENFANLPISSTPILSFTDFKEMGENLPELGLKGGC